MTHSTQAEVNIAMSMRLLNDMSIFINSNLALHVLHRGNALLHGDRDLALRHSKVVIRLQKGDRSMKQSTIQSSTSHCCSRKS